MNIGEFTLNKIAFEVRYPKAYRIWDVAGRVWERAASKWPELEMKSVVPNEQKFGISNHLEMSIHLDKANAVGSLKSANEETFIIYCEFLVEQLVETIGVSKFSRIGLRPTYIKRYHKIEEANQALLSTGVMRTPTGKNFGIEGSVTLPELNFRYESETLGIRIWLKAETSKLSWDGIFGDDEVKLEAAERHNLVLDIDYYTKADTLIGQFNASNWIQQALRVVRRDSKIILGT